MKYLLSYTFCVLWLAAFTCAFGQSPAMKSPKSPARVDKPHPVSKMPASSLSSTIDPVCKMALASEVVDTARYAGKSYGFCSKICKQRFHQHSAAYVR